MIGSQALEKLNHNFCGISLPKMIETQTTRKIKQIRSNDDSEYKNDPFFQLCQNKGIVRYFKVRDISH